MNRYSLSGESRRWWWPSVTAGVAASATIAAIALVPASTHAAQTSEALDRASAAAATVADDVGQTWYRPCFMIRPSWNTALDGPQPRCVTRAGDVRDPQAHDTTGDTRAVRELEIGA